MCVSPITNPQLGWQWRGWVGGMLTKFDSSIRDTSLRLAFVSKCSKIPPCLSFIQTLCKIPVGPLGGSQINRHKQGFTAKLFF